MVRGGFSPEAAKRDGVQLVASLLNLEKRRLKPGCYDSCARALEAVSRRVELIALLDNLSLGEGESGRLPCVRATETVAKFLASSYGLEEKPRHTRGTCMLSLSQSRGIALILNEIVDVYCRQDAQDCRASMALTVTNEPDLIVIELELEPAAETEPDISMLLISDLLEQHDATLDPAHIAGETRWRLSFPLGAEAGDT